MNNARALRGIVPAPDRRHLAGVGLKRLRRLEELKRHKGWSVK